LLWAAESPAYVIRHCRIWRREQKLTKQASNSSTDQGGGKRRAQERQTAEHRSGRLATSKSQCEAYVCDFFFLFFFFAMMLLLGDAPHPQK
jgi:hypothetical protein